MRIVRLNEKSRQDILANLLKRDPNNYSGYESTVQEIVENVRRGRDKSLLEYTRKFDGVDLTADQLRVTEEEIQEALFACGAFPPFGDGKIHEKYPGVS